MNRRIHAALSCAPVLVALAASACTGVIGSDDPAAHGPLGEDGQGQCVALPRRITLLTARQYENAVRDLLDLADEPHLSSAGGNPNALFHGGAKQVSDAMAFEYRSIAQKAALEATDALDQLVGCPGSEDDACAADFAHSFGARAFRRPLDTGEADKLLAVFQVGQEQDGTFRAGIQLMIEAVLQSPSFLYRTELGAKDGGGFRLTAHELMSELSFFLGDTVPDAALRQAADSGKLDDEAGVRAEVDRLLEDPAVRANVVEIFLRWMGTRQLAAVQKNADEFTPELRDAMIEETRTYVDEMLWTEQAALSSFLSTNRTWVDESLAAHYGVEYPGQPGDGFVEVELPDGQRAGPLTQAALMSTYAETEHTSIVRRGLFVYRNLLCGGVGAPPKEAAAVAQDIAQAESTMRGQAEARMAHEVCGGCHASFDPFGVLFEHYDAIGRYRDEADGEVIDSSFELTQPASIAGPTKDAVELADRLAKSPEVAACTSRQLLSYALGTPLAQKQSCMLDDVIGEGEDATALEPVEIVRRIAVSAALRARQDGGAQ